ncbi:hypothetical protein QN277_002430 [Acacia crassicarpa]|uniref:60S ribosomal protein L18a-like protein n=1 Tax=Acacia crassicarpa TaxID=499986 RepID=A0AAE1N9A5_9FABA|nr:hypothetical protein QN277_002430 [Acacia crassicarpa]
MSEDDKLNKGGHISGQQYPSAPPQYGTFYPPPAPPPPPEPHLPTGFPEPVPPPGSVQPPPVPPEYYAQGYQAVTGYPVSEARPARPRRLKCCGLGCGWCLFILGFFLAAIQWYAGAVILMCSRRYDIDPREKPGLLACSVAAVIVTIALIIGVTKGTKVW